MLGDHTYYIRFGNSGTKTWHRLNTNIGDAIFRHTSIKGIIRTAFRLAAAAQARRIMEGAPLTYKERLKLKEAERSKKRS